MKTNTLTKAFAGILLAACGVLTSHAVLLYQDTFESYPNANPAPNPLTNGPAGGRWFYVDPNGTLTQNEHRTYGPSTGGSALNSRVWISNGDNSRLTNAITISALPPGPGPHNFALSFLAATDSTTAGRDTTFRYAVSSSAGSLAFTAGGNGDGSQTLSDLAGYGIASVGNGGKTAARKFQIAFTGTGLNVGDKIIFDFTRVTNSGAAGAFIALDDVALVVETGAPVVTQNPASINNAVAGTSVSFTGQFSNYPYSYQWYKDGNPISGATTNTYAIPFVSKADEGSYVLYATNFEGTAYASTLPATLTVADTTKPTVASAKAVMTLQHVRVRFSEPVDSATASEPSNYTVSGAVVNAATLIDAYTVELLTTELTPGSNFTVSITNVQDLAGNAIVAGSSAAFATPGLTAAVAYNAGTSTTQPAGAPDPASAAGGYWAFQSNTNIGFSVQSVANDYGTELNSWSMVDPVVTAGSGVMDYRMKIDAASDNLARSNGWRLVVVSRIVDGDVFGTWSAPAILYSHPGVPRRYGIQFSWDGFALTASLLGGGSYPLPLLDPQAFHTHVISFDPATTNASYYVDGVLIANVYNGDSSTSYDGVAFGMGSSTGVGHMNFNKVELDVVGGTKPVLVSGPASKTVGVGQRVEFVANFTPFVGAIQWLTNGVVVPGATSTNWVIDYTTVAISGLQIKARALHAAGNVETDAAILSVTDDVTPPGIAGVTASMLLDRVLVTYSEHVDALYATNAANYTWGGQGITSVSARLISPAVVEVRTTRMQANTSYMLTVNNVRDSSNLQIANNTTAGFKTPQLVTIARYDAGTTATHPAGPPAPESVEGGSWTALIGNDPGLTTYAVMDDLSTGINAWQVSDQSTAAQMFIQYNFPQTAEQNASHRTNGWVLTIRNRFVDDYGNSALTCMAQYGQQDGQRHLIWFDHAANDEQYVWLHNVFGGSMTAPGDTAYHTHQIVFNPATTNASYYFDGELKYENWTGDVSQFTYAGVQWGTGAAANVGTMNVNYVEFQAIPAPSIPTLTMARNGVNVDVSYTGILESASALGGGWIPVSTNSTGSPQIISIPATGPQQFFRTKAVTQ